GPGSSWSRGSRPDGPDDRTALGRAVVGTGRGRPGASRHGSPVPSCGCGSRRRRGARNAPASGGRPGGARAGGRGKGGGGPRRAGGPELAHLLAEGVVAEAKALGGLLLAAAIDEDGVQGFVQALRIAGRLEEEAATTCVVHNDLLGCEPFRW